MKYETPESPRMLAWPRITGRLLPRANSESKINPAVIFETSDRSRMPNSAI